MLQIANLDQHQTLCAFSACSPTHLFHQLKASFVHAEISKTEDGIRIQDAYQSHFVEIQAFHNHLSAYQDVEPVLEDVKRRQSMGALKSSGPDGGWHLAEFPMAIIERYCNDAGVTFKEWMRNPDHVKRMLRDPALSGFRVHTGNA